MTQDLEVEAVILSDGTVTDDLTVIAEILEVLKPYFGPVG